MPTDAHAKLLAAYKAGDSTRTLAEHRAAIEASQATLPRAPAPVTRTLDELRAHLPPPPRPSPEDLDEPPASSRRV